MSTVTDHIVNNSDIDRILSALDNLILGKSQQMRLALACLLARGHLLIEDIPGVGKTTLAHALAQVLGLEFRRIQFTSDLLPADIIGASIYRSDHQDFRFMPGPVFTQMVLADEINRATPKTQGALLEAMEECQVTIDGISHALPQPFFVIATQNPRHLVGTYPLPESQLDRFLMRIELGYPGRDAERELLKGAAPRDQLQAMQPVLNAVKLLALQKQCKKIFCSDALLDYVQDLVDTSRHSDHFALGLSPRAALALVNSARAWALLEKRNMVIPEDIQAVLGSVVNHRLQGSSAAEQSANLAQQLLEAVAIP